MFTTRTLWEGRWPIAVLTVLSLAGWLWCWPVAIIPLLLLIFTIWFFRDPERKIPSDPNAIVSPADGKIVEVKAVPEPQFMKSDATMVAIFLSVFDVHVQRAPVAGKIAWGKYSPGKFLDARHPQAGILNESRGIGIEVPGGMRMTVRQIAGLIARRIVGWAGEGAQVQKGDRIGMIRFGSRVELYLPPGIIAAVRVGERVKGGETIVARKQ